MSSELSELRDAIAKLALEHSIDEIPQLYFEKMVQTWQEMNSKGYGWELSNAAAALLHSAVVDGIVHMSQMTPQGYRALNWAETYMKKLDAKAVAS